jgi:hypothetical protein
MKLHQLLPTRIANALRWPRNWYLQRREWDARIHDVVSSPDNALLERVPGAGSIKNGWQTMHNGLFVAVDGYYGNGITRMLKVNKGCHEPQEEIVFNEVLKRLPEDPVMIECGAYWAFYSMWFLKARPMGRAFMIEPDPANLKVGAKNFAYNGYKGVFENAGLGEAEGRMDDGTRIVSVTSFMSSHGLERADVLHMDIQGAEFATLRGAAHLLLQRLIDYVFVSTHSGQLHEDCLSLLRGVGYLVEVTITPEKSCSVDGVIVARSPSVVGDRLPLPSEK